jgi:hypothetical protein
MEGNLVADEDLGKQSNGAEEEKAGCGTGSGVRSSICDICVDLNDEAKTSWKMRRQLDQNKTAFGIGRDETENKQRIASSRCLLQDLPELANVSNYLSRR